MLSVPTVSGRCRRLEAVDEVADDAGVALGRGSSAARAPPPPRSRAGSPRSRSRPRLEVSRRRPRAACPACRRSATRSPSSVRIALGAPGAAVGARRPRRRTRRSRWPRRHARTRIPPGWSRGSRPRAASSRSAHADRVEGVDRHVEQQHMLHLVAEAAEMRADEEVAVDRRQRARARPGRAAARTRCRPGWKRRFWMTACTRPVSAASATSARASSIEFAIGFSDSTCAPLRSAAVTTAAAGRRHHDVEDHVGLQRRRASPRGRRRPARPPRPNSCGKRLRARSCRGRPGPRPRSAPRGPDPR